MMRIIRYSAWGLVAALFLAIAGVTALSYTDGRALPGAVRVGVPFELTRSDGTRFSSEALAGAPYAIFFGFTHCPDICPTKLNDLSNLLADLKDDADRLKVLFVSLDSERDTPKLLAAYLGAFDRRIVALTGSAGEIKRVADGYRIKYERVPTSDSYTLNHEAAVFVFDRRGNLVSTLAPNETTDVQLTKLKMALAR
jgi:protein SCO1/2